MTNIVRGKQIDTSDLAFATPASASQAVTKSYQDQKMLMLAGWGALSAPAGVAAKFLDFANNRDIPQPLETSSLVAMPLSGTIVGFSVHVSGPLTVDSVTFVLRKNKVNTALQVTLPANTASATLTGQALQFSAGDLFSISVFQSASQVQAAWGCNAQITYISSDGELINADARDYYVSALSGSDTNPGTQAAPWRTARKASQYVFQQGFKCRFERGGSYDGPLKIHGNGTFDKTTFDATYTTALASAITTLNGDGTRSTYHAALITDGFTDPTANTLSDQFVASLAANIARKAAFAAADPGSTWLTYEAYGVGANPIILGGSDFGGIWFGSLTTFTGGVKVTDIDVGSALLAGYLYDPGPLLPVASSGAPSFIGLWIERSRVSGVTFPTIFTGPGNTYPGPYSPYIPFCGSGFDLTQCTYLYMKDVEVDHCDAFGFIWGAPQSPQHIHIENLNCHHSYIGSLHMQGISSTAGTLLACSGGEIENLVMNNVCYAASPTAQGPGFFKGESGPLFANAQNWALINPTITGVPVVHADGIGIDMEGTQLSTWGTMLISGGTIANCEGTTFLANDSVGHAGSFLIDGVAMTLNRCTQGQPPVAGVTSPCVKAARTTGDQWVFTRNVVTRGLIGMTPQTLWSGDAVNTYTPTTNVAPTGTTLGPSNTVI